MAISANHTVFSFPKTTANRKHWLQWIMPGHLARSYSLAVGDRIFVTVRAGNQLIDCGSCYFGVSDFFYINRESEEAIKDALTKEPSEEIVFYVEINNIGNAKKVSTSSSHKPIRRLVQVWVYDRDPEVVKMVLERAGGRCERCLSPAPFMRSADGTPYLEVHHTVPLADDGDDTVENAEALCPNCHRQAHHG